MIIDKILNNNVVVVIEDDKEKIVMGRGLAFGKKVGSEIDESLVNKVFTLDNSVSSKYQELVSQIPMEYTQVSYQIVSYAKSELGKNLKDSIYLALTDHLYSSIKRFKEGILIHNPLLYDIQRFYQEEYCIALKSLDIIEKHLKVKLPKDEAGNIALHLVNASFDEENMQNAYEITKVMQEITNIVKYTFNVEFDKESVYYYRYVTHLKFFAQRLLSNSIYKNCDDDLLDMIKIKYKNSYGCVEKINKFVKKEYGYTLSDEEKVYLTIHIERVVYKSGAITSLDVNA